MRGVINKNESCDNDYHQSNSRDCPAYYQLSYRGLSQQKAEGHTRFNLNGSNNCF